MKSKAYIVAGNESSGNKLLRSILVSLPRTEEIKQSKSDEWANGSSAVSYFKDKDIVIFKSLPSYPIKSGKRYFIDILDIKEKLVAAGWDVYIIIPTRDKSCVLKSKVKNHTKAMPKAVSDMKIANDIIKKVINSNSNYMLFSYETFMLLGYDYLVLLYDFIGVRSTYMPVLKDGNKKYLK